MTLGLFLLKLATDSEFYKRWLDEAERERMIEMSGFDEQALCVLRNLDVGDLRVEVKAEITLESREEYGEREVMAIITVCQPNPDPDPVPPDPEPESPPD